MSSVLLFSSNLLVLEKHSVLHAVIHNLLCFKNKDCMLLVVCLIDFLLQNAVSYVFGSTFVCRDSEAAKEVMLFSSGIILVYFNLV
jgi:hypothetical protein